MTIKKTSNRSSVKSIEADLDFIRGKYVEHQKELEDARIRRVDAEKKQTEIIVDAKSYGQASASKQVEECKQIVAASYADEREAEISLEGARKRITELEESLVQAKVRQVKAEVKKFGEHLSGEAPGIAKLLKNFTDRIEVVVKSCVPVDGKIRDLGSDYFLRIQIEKALSGWLVAQMYHLFPKKFERPHRSSSTREFLWDGELKDVLEKQFELVLRDSKLTDIDEPIIDSSGLYEVRVVPVSEKLREQAEEMREKVVA